MHESGEQIPIEQVDSKKDLEVTFESTLRFDKHILNCVDKANRMNAGFNQTFVFIHGQKMSPPSPL